MKKIIAILLCMVLVLSVAVAEDAANAMPVSPAPGELLGFELLNVLHTDGKNRVLSPQSLALALGMAAEGANGDTLTEILDALGVESVQEISARLPEGLKSANAAFTAPELALNPEYIDRLNEAYGAQWFEMDADVVENVNAWVKEHTDGMIDEMLADAPAPEAAMILINAIAMDAQWQNPFTPEFTVEEVFHAPAGDVAVQMMHQTEHFDYAEKDGVQIVRLPYRGNELEMWIAMPEQGEMPALLERLAEEGMAYLSGDACMYNVTLGLPKMDIADENTLSDALKLLGVETAFSDRADFFGISNVPLYVDSILQKVRVQTDEMGTKAAAATAMIMKAYGMLAGPENAEMIINRPFVFAIADAGTGNVCFAGVIENPVEN